MLAAAACWVLFRRSFRFRAVASGLLVLAWLLSWIVFKHAAMPMSDCAFLGALMAALASMNAGCEASSPRQAARLGALAALFTAVSLSFRTPTRARCDKQPGAVERPRHHFRSRKRKYLRADILRHIMTNAADNQPFHHYTTKHRIVSWISQHLFDNLTYTVRHGLLKGMKRRGGLGWLPQSIVGNGGSPEQAFWSKLNVKNLVVYDVGAFQGLLTLFYAQQARTVISYEPNTTNHARLVENIRLNRVKNVTVRKLGVGSETHTATMVASPLMSGGATIESNSVEGLRASNLPLVSEEISIVRLDDDIGDASLPAPDFIKIDIEGQELAALIGAHDTITAHRPQLFLEMHGETMNLKRKKVRDIVAYLGELGYTNIRHVETGTQITTGNSDVAAEGHLYCGSPGR